jgi:Putative transposase
MGTAAPPGRSSVCGLSRVALGWVRPGRGGGQLDRRLVNARAMTTLWCAPGRETIEALLGDVKDMGARPGSSAALHPWSQTLVVPPHRHGWVTGGGRTDARDGHSGRNGVLWPVRVVMAVVRGKRLAAMDMAVRGGPRSIGLAAASHLMRSVSRQQLVFVRGLSTCRHWFGRYQQL